MNNRSFATIDGNEAVAQVVYRLNEVIAYSITSSSPMAEWVDAWANEGKRNIWGTVPSVVQMESAAGVAGNVHDALQTGSLTTTFTASQALLLMLPNMYKIAREFTPTVFHIAARSLAAQALSIFGDHSDVMTARDTGFAMLCAASVQEAQDFALIATRATLESRIPFLHFFDGFRTSHEINQVETLTDDDLREFTPNELIFAHRSRALTCNKTVLRCRTQNPDVYFQARKTVNPYYLACPDITQKVMDEFAAMTGRQYQLFEYHGDPEAERVIVLMGSGCEAVHEIVNYLNTLDQKVGVLKVKLYRPYDAKRFVAALPETTRSIAVLDCIKEPGASGEPLYLDVVAAIRESWGVEEQKSRGAEVKLELDSPLPLRSSAPLPKIIGGRYGLSSKEFTPAMIKAIFENLAATQRKKRVTQGKRI